jgi:hypothetical protein
MNNCKQKSLVLVSVLLIALVGLCFQTPIVKALKDYTVNASPSIPITISKEAGIANPPIPGFYQYGIRNSRSITFNREVKRFL